MQNKILKLLQSRFRALKAGDPLGLPITATSNYYLPGGPEADYTYTREGNPSWSAVEAQLEILEGAPALAFPSGMAAISAVLLTQLKPGERLIMASDGYFGARAFAEDFLKPLGVEITYHPTRHFHELDMTGAQLVWIETPSNPGLDICDIRQVATKAHAGGAKLALDNTTACALLQPGLDLGADIVVVADTKVMNGHGDLLFGHVASRDEGVMSRLHHWRGLSGSIPSAHDAVLLHRGLDTLELRLARMCDTAEMMAAKLAEHPKIQNLRYPGLPQDPAHELAKRQMHRFGYLIGFELADAETADKFLNSCTGLVNATSFGSVHSSAERRARWGEDIAPGFIRLSIGCEPASALWQSFETALDAL